MTTTKELAEKHLRLARLYESQTDRYTLPRLEAVKLFEVAALVAMPLNLIAEEMKAKDERILKLAMEIVHLKTQIKEQTK